MVVSLEIIDYNENNEDFRFTAALVVNSDGREHYTIYHGRLEEQGSFEVLSVYEKSKFLDRDSLKRAFTGYIDRKDKMTKTLHIGAGYGFSSDMFWDAVKSRSN